jgi:preprotein translocase subunit Sec63
VITDIGSSTRKWRIQFQAPAQVATYAFQLQVKSDSYVGTDVLREVELVVEDASKLEEEEKTVEEVIPEGSGTFPHFIVGWGLIGR